MSDLQKPLNHTCCLLQQPLLNLFIFFVVGLKLNCTCRRSVFIASRLLCLLSLFLISQMKSGIYQLNKVFWAEGNCFLH